jgi:PAS domain S-box-containing protein
MVTRTSRLNLFSRLAVAPALLALGLACTVGAYEAVRSAEKSSERRVLEQRANEFSGLIAAALRNTHAVLEATGAIAEATDGSREALATMRQRVGQSGLTSLVVVRADAVSRPIARLGQFDAFLLERLPVVRSRLRDVARTGAFRVVGAAPSRDGRVIGFASAPQPKSRFVAYGEITVPQVAQADESPELLLYSIYLGSEPSAAGLLASNVLRGFPSGVPRTTRVLDLADEKLSLVVGARSVGATQFSSWLILLFGGLISAALAGVLEMRRRRGAAIRSADELREQSDQLQGLMAELRESEERYRLLVEVSPDMIAMQTEGRIVYVNQKGVELLGASSRDDLVGKLLLEIVHPDFHDLARRRIHEVIERRNAVPFVEQRLVRLDGETIDVEVAGLPASFQGRAASHLVVRDISERKLAEAERVRFDNRLRESQKMEAVGRLAGGVAHDFNNLLTVIGGYGELLLDYIPDGEPNREDVEEIIRAADQAAALTRQLLTFSRQTVFEQELVDLNDVVSEMEKMLTRVIGEEVTVVTRLESALAPVKASRAQLEQVVANLVINARDAMPGGGNIVIETGTASVEANTRPAMGLPEGRYMTLSVSDEGIGMDDETRSRIFEPFFTTKGVGEGTGLGLAMVYASIQKFGGEIWVYSELGRGTTFKIYLPEAAGESEQEDLSSPSAELDGSETILLVEDNERVRALARRALTEHGYQTIEAAAPRQALELAAAHEGPIDLLVTDVVMPGMGGVDLAQALRQSRPELGVLYMSGYTEGRLEREGVLNKEAVFLAKPFGPVDLIRSVRRIIDAMSTGPAESPREEAETCSTVS